MAFGWEAALAVRALAARASGSGLRRGRRIPGTGSLARLADRAAGSGSRSSLAVTLGADGAHVATRCAYGRRGLDASSSAQRPPSPCARRDRRGASSAGRGPSGWVVPLGLSFTVFRLIGVVLDVNALRIPLSVVAAVSRCRSSFRRSPPARSRRPLRSATWRVRNPYDRPGRRLASAHRPRAVPASSCSQTRSMRWSSVRGSRRGISQLRAVRVPRLADRSRAVRVLGLRRLQRPRDRHGTAPRLRGSENVDRPCSSRNLSDFWRRWHITLSEWIRGRLMMKMAGRRPSLWRLHGATLASMALCGLWHGAGVGFLVWGLWHGLGLASRPCTCSVTRSGATRGSAISPSASSETRVAAV